MLVTIVRLEFDLISGVGTPTGWSVIWISCSA
jgi:hypothetical protein